MICTGCVKTVSIKEESAKYNCEICRNTRFSQFSIPPRICDVCAVGKKQCQICGSPINGGTRNTELDDLQTRRKQQFYSKIKGVTMVAIRQDNLQKLHPGQQLYYIHESDNQFDPNAIKLFADEGMTLELGYVSKELSPDLLGFMNNNKRFMIEVSEVTGGGPNRSYGCNIKVTIQ